LLSSQSSHFDTDSLPVRQKLHSCFALLNGRLWRRKHGHKVIQS
jgi:hypothetical protein